MAQVTLLDRIRSTLYAAGFYPVTVIYAIPCLLIGPLLPFRARFAVLAGINFFYLFWLRVTCGVKVQIEGRENLPKEGAFVTLSNHQSEWETMFLHVLIRPQVIVLKKELLKIPFFGWALSLLKPIALDRSQRRGALKQLLTQGKARLLQGIPVTIFPQGTRVPVGKLGRFNKGGAMLAASAGVPVVPIVHNAGIFWPGKGFIKKPGTIIVRIGKPMQPPEGNGAVEALHEKSIGWMTQQMVEIGALNSSELEKKPKAAAE